MGVSCVENVGFDFGDDLRMHVRLNLAREKPVGGKVFEGVVILELAES